MISASARYAAAVASARPAPGPPDMPASPPASTARGRSAPRQLLKARLERRIDLDSLRYVIPDV